MQRAIRTTDMAARYGGDEFVVFLPGATPEVAETVAQRIRNNVYRSLFPVGERLQRMTVSVGTASYPRDGAQEDDIVAAADQRMRRDRELAERRPAGSARARPAVRRTCKDRHAATCRDSSPAASAAALWRALTDPAMLSLWYATEAEVEPQVGGRYYVVTRLFGKRDAHIERFEPGRGCNCCSRRTPTGRRCPTARWSRTSSSTRRKGQRMLRVSGLGYSRGRGMGADARAAAHRLGARLRATAVAAEGRLDRGAGGMTRFAAQSSCAAGAAA